MEEKRRICVRISFRIALVSSLTIPRATLSFKMHIKNFNYSDVNERPKVSVEKSISIVLVQLRNKSYTGKRENIKEQENKSWRWRTKGASKQ